MAVTLRRARRGALIVALMTLFACSPQADVPEPTATSETTATTTQPPTPEELAGEAALEALADMVAVQDAARRDPAGRDWEPEIRQVAGDPFASVAVASIRRYATGGIKQVGDSAVTAEVTDVDLTAVGGPTVLLKACFDNSASDVVRVDNGESILSPDEPTRFVWNLTVTQPTSGEPWLVTVLEPHPEQPC